MNNDDHDEYFGGEHIRVVGSNPIIARGAFGEISLAVFCSSSSSSDTNDKQQQQQQQQQANLLRLVAVKTLIRPPPHCPSPSPHAPLTTNSKDSKKNHDDNEDDPVANELHALRVLNPHDNIVQLLAVYPSSRQQGMIMTTGHALCAAFAYCPVDLDLALSWRRRTLRPMLPMPVIQMIARDLFAALHHCHAHGILHRDVKPQNCLVSSCNGGCIQLCDFGLALRILTDDADQSRTLRQDTRLCTLHYRPPEVLLGARAIHKAVDIYSAGLTIVEVLSGGDGCNNNNNALFCGGTNDLSQLMCIFKALGTPTRETWPLVHELPDWGKLTFTTQSPMFWTDLVPRAAEECGRGGGGGSSSCLVDFLQGCIRLDPAQRQSAADCLKHAWLAPSASDADTSCSDSATTFNTNTRRTMIVMELVPPELREPLLLAPPSPSPYAAINNDDEDWTVVKRQVLRHATTRRGFLKSLEPWKD